MSKRTLLELLYGKGAHANPLACVEDVSAELAGQRPENFPHSIWQLLNHMNYWMSYELRRIRGEKPAYPAHAAESWLPAPAPSGEAGWIAAVALFRDLLAQLAALADSSPDQLARTIDATHPDHVKHSSSLEAVLWQTLVHNSYHVGQIAVLRRALGAWPPSGGGDSW
jgi:uncharacterized damage-inducible protein DinB